MNEKWGIIGQINAMYHFDTCPRYRWTKDPTLIRVKILMYALKSMLEQYARFIHIHFSYLGVNWWKWIGAKNRIYWPVIFVEWVVTIFSFRFEWPFKKFGILFHFLRTQVKVTIQLERICARKFQRKNENWQCLKLTSFSN